MRVVGIGRVTVGKQLLESCCGKAVVGKLLWESSCAQELELRSPATPMCTIPHSASLSALGPKP